ncbi:MAG: T9SS type A sorting domain-containing protein [Bacteroidetes bacterium]|nr:T9SS type A sorting domain-containing protein [Bacteroidota bacterium]
MKRITLTLAFFLLLVISYAQEWAPLGATWYYQSVRPTDGLQWYAEIQSIGDTIIQGKHCKVLQSHGVGISNFGSEFSSFFISSGNGKVFYYNQSCNKFCQLYDFNKLPGDTFYIPTFCNNNYDSVGFIIGSVSLLTIDTTVLKVQSVTPINTPSSQYQGFPSQIIETLGSTSFLFPIHLPFSDAPYTYKLLCYTDSKIHYHYPPQDFCNTIGIKEEKTNDKIEIYPNPASLVLTIDLTDNIEVKYSINIYSIIGQKKISMNNVIGNKVTEIPIGKLSSGLYLIEITTTDGQKLMKKFIKE